MGYTKKDFEEDLVSQELNHIKSLDRFAGFYNELGKHEQIKKMGYVGWRMDWIKPIGPIIELGCHAGYNLIHYAKQGFNITGVDVSKSLLDEARSRISKQPVHIRKKITTVKSFIEQLPTEDKYNTVLLTETLEHVINPKTTLEKARDLLTDKGLIYVTSPSERTGNNSHVRGISRKFLDSLCSDIGLTVLKYEDIKGMTAAVIIKSK